MGVALPEVEDTEMNMTPMIDIVFQLIIFFLLSLKFKSVDRRIQSELPKDRGIRATSEIPEEKPMLTVKLFREDMQTQQPFTRIRIGNRIALDGPKGDWAGDLGNQDDTRQDKQDALKAQVVAAIRGLWDQMGKNPETKGEIKTPPPFGQGVPHGDVMLVLDAFIEAGVTDVQFEGAMPPAFVAGQGGVIEAN
jgi:biopolymer transport protein ExbD